MKILTTCLLDDYRYYKEKLHVCHLQQLKVNYKANLKKSLYKPHNI